MDDRVLILGAGINGAAIARELALNGVGSTIVDVHDIASGATAYSSRLIHGGLRYLEYGEFDLVRESLEERTRWLRLAPQFVRPLRLFIPIRNRRGGLLAGARKFLGLKPRRGVAPAKHRGLWSIRVGLWLYDVYAHDPTLPRRRLYKSRSPKVVPVDSTKYRWMYSFSDAQIVYPERFTLAMLEDARQIAADQKIPFEVCTYHRAALEGDTVTVTPVDERGANPALEFKPAAIVNATGAWVDRTLAALHVPSKSLMGGTKGSHFITHHESLRNRLKGRAIYVEAADGRPVFVLPFGDATLVGTTDLPFTDDPAKAVATPEELQYLVDAVNDLFPDLRLTTGDISLHYSGVRPLPASGPATPAAVTRRHWLEPNDQCPIPMYSVIGGKLTTCRSLAEESAGIILARLGLEQKVNSRERPLPGGKEHPRDSGQLQSEWNRIAARFGLERSAVEAIWSLVGTRSESILADATQARGSDATCLSGTSFPRGFVRWMIANEWCTTLEDLVERRLMLLYHPNLTRKCLDELARLLIDAGRLSSEEAGIEVERTIERLANHFGKRVKQ